MPETDRLQHLKVNEGTYVLILKLKSEQGLLVGKLGRFTFPSGWYAYVGSALGPGGLAARLRHHLHLAGRPHWHMDFLRPCAGIREIWYSYSLTFDEHCWADILQRMAGTRTIAPGFGSSDCRCATHLIYFATQPAITRFRRRQSSRPGMKRRPVYRLPMVDV